MPNNALTRTVKWVIWFLPAYRYRRQTRRSILELEDLLATFESQWKNARSLGLKKYSTLYNSIFFLLLLYYDFAVLSYNHAIEVDERKQNLYARQLCHLLHEALEDLPSVFGREFRTAVMSFPDGNAHVARIAAILKRLSALRNSHQSTISNVRNFVAAHRDHDALKQLEIMRGLNSNWLISISAEFVSFLGQMALDLTPLVAEMGNPKVIMSHVANKA